MLLLWGGKIDLPHDAAILAVVRLPYVRLLLAFMYSNLLDVMRGLRLLADRIELEAGIAGLAVLIKIARLFCPRELLVEVNLSLRYDPAPARELLAAVERRTSTSAAHWALHRGRLGG